MNRSLSNLLRCLVGDHIKSWDQHLSQAEFAHNHTVSYSTGFSPFQVVYLVQLKGPLDLMALPSRTKVHRKVANFVTGLQEVHKTVHDKLSWSNAKYKLAADQRRRHLEFDVEDFV